jgi:competence protein ComGC
MKSWLKVRHGYQAFSLIEILVVVIIIVLIGGFLTNHYLGSKDLVGKKQKTPITAAHNVECMENLRSIRQSIMAAHTMDSDGKYPQSLTELKELPASMLKCPVGGEPYIYDPATGAVHCVHPGHEAY